MAAISHRAINPPLPPPFFLPYSFSIFPDDIGSLGGQMLERAVTSAQPRTLLALPGAPRQNFHREMAPPASGWLSFRPLGAAAVGEGAR